MTEILATDFIDPLLEKADSDQDIEVRLDAVDIATRLPLEEEAWFAVADSVNRVLSDSAIDSDDRRRALEIAVRVPLLTFRKYLRRIASDADDLDGDILNDKLAEVGDPSQAGRLLEEASHGRDEVFEALAAMPLEHADVEPGEIAPVARDGDPNAALWRALTLARLGDFQHLDSILEAGQDLGFTMFYGDPWTPHDRIAAMRPVPPPMREHLLDALSRGQINDIGRSIVWAVTGVADAEGNPVEEPEAVSPVEPIVMEITATPDQETEARAAVERLLAGFNPENEPSSDDLDALVFLSAGEAADFVTRLVGEGNRLAAELPPDVPPQIVIGNQILSVVEKLQANDRWPVAELSTLFVEGGALDCDQMAWVIGSAPAQHTISDLARLVPLEGTDRARLIPLNRAVADRYAGRSGSPWRGAAGGGGEIIGRGPLIDETPEEAALDRSPPPAAPESSRHTGAVPVPDRSPATRTSSSPQPSPLPSPAVDASPSRGGGSVLRSLGSYLGSMLGSRSSTAAAPTMEEGVEGPATASEEERRVVAQIRNQGQPRNTFVSGTENIIRCWIGLDTPEVGAAAGEPIPGVPIPPQGLTLDVVLVWNDQTDRGTVHLPAHRTARASECDLHIQIPQGERFVSAEIAFLYRGRVFEIVRVEAFVVAPSAAEEPHHTMEVKVQAAQREVIELEDSREVDAVMVFGADRSRDGDPGHRRPSTLRVFGRLADGSYDLGDADEAIEFLNHELFTAAKSMVRRRARQGRTEEVLDTSDKDVLFVLRTLARHGAALFNSLTGQGFTDPGERLQVFNKDPKEYAPVEFVYDRGFPIDDAKICEEGLAALDTDAEDCPHCPSAANLSDDLRDANPVICPFGFWSLQKIIERRDPVAHEADESAEHSFPVTDRRHLPPIDSVLFASSHNVEEPDRTATWESLKSVLPNAFRAASWPEWRTTLDDQRPSLLLALPHHGVENNLDYLEIGDGQLPKSDRQLSRGRLTKIYTNPHDHDPGPIVLLLGCRTGTDTEVGYVALARRFQQLRTSIVLGTLAKVLGRHAAPVARELVAQLAAIEDPEIDFGTVMRRVRRRMLAKGYLMALCLVALGDAEWRLTARPTIQPQGGTNVPD